MTDELFNDWGSSEAVEHSAGKLSDLIEKPAANTEQNAEQTEGEQQEAGQESEQQVISEVDDAQMQTCVAELTSLWGDKTDANIAKVRQLVDNAPPEISEFLKYGRLSPDQPAIGNNPLVLRWLASLAPNGAVQSGTNSNDIGAEIKQIESMMGTKAYRRDEAMQARYRSLIAARGR